MKSRFLLILSPFLATLALADTVTLKSGETLTGKILRESAEAVVVEYAFSPTITDERQILRADIVDIRREQADLKAFEGIQSIELPTTALDVAVYDEVIVGKLEPFLKLYPYSAYCPTVRAKMAEFEAEKARLIAGQLKLEGGWISDARIEAEKYQLDARRTYDVQKAQFAKSNLIGSLNQFDKIEKNWPLSAVYPESVELARVTLEKLDQVLTHELRIFPVREEQRRLMLERTRVEDRARIEASQKAEKENALASLAAVKKDLKFPAYSLLIKESMEGLQKGLQADEARLALLDLKLYKTGIVEAQQAAALIEQNQLAVAATALKNAEAAWPQLELLPRLKKRLDDARQAASVSTDAQAKAVENAADLQKQQSQTQQP